MTTGRPGDLVSARYATLDDLDTTVALINLEEGTLRDQRGGAWHLDHDRDTQSDRDRHHHALEAPDQQLLVGCIDGAVVAHALARLSSTRRDAPLCMIDELIVHPQARGLGVGSALLEATRSWALAHGCLAIESQVLPGNRAAKNFFERVGMKTRKMRVSADL